MAEDSAVREFDLSDPPAPPVNGFPRLAAATAEAAPAPPPPTTTPPGQLPRPEAPAPQQRPPSADGAPPPHDHSVPDPQPPAPPSGTLPPPAANPSGPADPTPYLGSPERLPEDALLGSLIYAPQAFEHLDRFLRARDFSTPPARAVFLTLRELHQSGALFDLTALPTEAARLHAAEENRLKLYVALRAGTFTDVPVDNLPALMATLAGAAPPAAVPFRGVYDPQAQVALGRMVLEDACRRQLDAMSTLMTRSAPLITPTQLGRSRGERQARTIAGNVEVIQHQLRAITDRLIAATHNPTNTTSDSSRQADVVAARAHRRWRLPAPLRAITDLRLRRAERHLIHLALHCGRMDTVPPQILALRPEDFTTERHANTWRAIQHCHAQGLPINYVSVAHTTRTHHLGPVLLDQAHLELGWPPDTTPRRVARSLHTVATAALTRAARDSRRTLTAVAGARTVPILDALTHAGRDLDTLAARATTAAALHHAATHPHRAEPKHRSAR